MAIFCGVDIIEIDRIRRSFETLGDSFRDRIYTENEINYCEGKRAARFQSYAVRFAAKEAVSKALGTGIAKGISLKDIEVANDDKGKPFVVLHRKAKEIFDEIQGLEVALSLSHCENYAVAYAVLQSK